MAPRSPDPMPGTPLSPLSPARGAVGLAMTGLRTVGGAQEKATPEAWTSGRIVAVQRCGISFEREDQGEAKQCAALPPLSPRTKERSVRLRDGASSPAWSLRYAELLQLGPGAERRGAAAEQQAHPAQLESALLAGRSRDRRLPPEDAPKRERPSRLEQRRQGLYTHASRRQALAAVRSAWQYRPRHMRRLAEQCEMPNSVLRRSRALSGKELERISDDTGMQNDDIQELFVAFHRYDLDASGYLDRAEVRQVLCDLGLQPRTPEEKAEVAEILCDQDLEGLGRFACSEFLQLVSSVRARLRELRVQEYLPLFEGADVDNNLRLDLDEALCVLERAAPVSQAEREEAAAAFHAMAAEGSLGFEEFQQLAQRVRARLLTRRREEELNIARMFHLEAELFAEFRMDLPHFYDVFQRYDHDSSGRVAPRWLPAIFADVGLPEDDGALEPLTFPAVLERLLEVRRECKLQLEPLRFPGKLPLCKLFGMLEDFAMLPRSKEEQLSIVDVLERIDSDGSGSLDFAEFQDFLQRHQERVHASQRAEERAMALDLGFIDRQLQEARAHFQMAGPYGGRVGRLAALHASCGSELWDDARLRELCHAAQLTPDRQINFEEFLQTLRPLAG